MWTVTGSATKLRTDNCKPKRGDGKCTTGKWRTKLKNRAGKWRTKLKNRAGKCRTGLEFGGPKSRAGKCRTRKWRNKEHDWKMQDWKMKDNTDNNNVMNISESYTIRSRLWWRIQVSHPNISEVSRQLFYNLGRQSYPDTDPQGCRWQIVLASKRRQCNPHIQRYDSG